MSDPAFALLEPVLNDPARNVLWLVDENIDERALARIRPRASLRAISNRFDVAGQLRERGFAVEFSDFDFSAEQPGSLPCMVYRVSKEKPVVHHVINSASRLLAPAGRLWLAGMKQEGIKTYQQKAAALLGGVCDVQRGQRQAMAACLQRGDPGEALDDKDYPRLREVVVGEQRFVSKPGLFGWDKVDRGSALLVEQLSSLLDQIGAPEQVADIGCGYGYLSMMAASLCQAEFTATDNNAAALRACSENFRRCALRGQVLAGDCADTLPSSRFDLVLCNPPFHQGFELEQQLTRRFVEAARRLCRPGGRALFVVNAFVPIERASEGLFAARQLLYNDRRFKVLVFNA